MGSAPDVFDGSATIAPPGASLSPASGVPVSFWESRRSVNGKLMDWIEINYHSRRHFGKTYFHG
jgi:hypothetical protein